jgi:hypothetical protein
MLIIFAADDSCVWWRKCGGGATTLVRPKPYSTATPAKRGA